MVRAAAKAVVETGLLLSGAAYANRRRLRGRTVVLAYHNVVEPETPPCGDGSLHIPIERFRHHLDTIERVAEVVPISELFDTRDGTRPRVVLTFDDAYRGAVRLALPELARRQMPATVFVPPLFVPDGSFWWDDLGRLPGGLSEARRIVALNECRGRDEEVRRRYADELPAGAAPPADACCATLAELRHAVGVGQVALGSHTWSHVNLARATPAEVVEELSRSLAWLREQFPTSHLPALSYPYGLDSDAARAAAAAAGYQMGFLVAGGWLPTGRVEPLALPRLNIPAALSARGLALRLSGLFT